MDKITIKGIVCFGNHGLLPEEQVLGQKFIVHCTVHTEIDEAAKSGNIKKTVNYAELSQFIKKYTEENTFALIETLAENLARGVLRRYPVVKTVDIEVEKPWAPIGLMLDTVSVQISRSRHRVYLALGSNIGDKKAHLDAAVDKLNQQEDFQVKRVSDYIETKPYGGVAQDDFLNGVLEGETFMNPMELLDFIHEVEASEGRERLIHWGPRTLDIDIIFYDDLVMDTQLLTIPHKEMHKRDFVLRPMVQLAPWLRHPLLHRTVEELFDEQ